MVRDLSEDGDQRLTLGPRSRAKAKKAKGSEKPRRLDLMIMCLGQFGQALVDLDKV